MDDSIENKSIDGTNEILGVALDYQALKKIGLEAIIRLGSDKWTDYNEHDPGITILETLIYALTDLAYRTDFPIEDILAQQQLSPGQLAKNQFLTARNALSINPLTLSDFRKLIIDIPGVQNAWVLPQQHAFEASRGLLDIIVDPDEEIVSTDDKKTLLNKVLATFYRHRNICQDLGQVHIREPFQVYFNLQLTVDHGAMTEELIAKVLLELKNYLDNAVQFLTFEEAMSQFNGDINSVYDGPALMHGFLPDDALKPALFELKSIDLIPIISKIQGVINIQELQFRTSIDDLGPYNYLENNPKWVYQKKLPIDEKPVIAPIQEHIITIKKGDKYQKWTLPAVLINWKNLNNKQRRSKLSPEARDVAIPVGQYRELSDYFSIQEEFPRVYGLDPHGPPEGADEERLAKIKQLKGYLLIFDQIMANYLAQLSHVGELFSWSPEVKRTYFFQGLQDAVNHLTELLVNDISPTPNLTQQPKYPNISGQQQTLQLYLDKLAELREDKGTFLQRRNRFLDHLLARFGLSLSAFSSNLEKTTSGKEQDTQIFEQLEIETKQRVLGNFRELSMQRGKAFNIFQEEADISSQYSGLRRWVETLLDFKPETIDTFRFNERFIEGNYNAAQPDDNQVGEFVFVTDDGSPVDFKELMRIGGDPENYKVDFPKADKPGSDNSFGLSIFKLKDITKKSKLYRLNRNFDTAEQALAAIEELVELFKTYNQTSERIYIVEHLLLRPYPDEKYFGLALLDADGEIWLQTTSWYSRNNLELLKEIIKEDYAYYDLQLAQPSSPPVPPASPPLPPASPLIPATEGQTASPLVGKFTFSAEAIAIDQYQVNLAYGFPQQSINLSAHKTFKTPDEVKHTVLYWLKSLAKFNFFPETDNTGKYHLNLAIGEPENIYYFEAETVFDSQSDLEKTVALWKKHPVIYKFSIDSPAGNNTKFAIRFVYESIDVFLAFTSREMYDTEEQASGVREFLEKCLDKENDIAATSSLWKTFFKPWPWDQSNTPVQDDEYRYLFNDPFSFVLTIIIPDWPARFQQRAFKETILQILQAEAPAHLWLNILWLNKSDFQEFRFIYGNWWRAFSQKEAGAFYYRKILMDFMMNQSFLKK